MKCPSCGHENREGAKFCIGCAQPLLAEVVCSQCGHTNPQGAKFCEQCAYFLAEPAPAPTIPPPLETASFKEKLDKIQRYLLGRLTEKMLAQRGKIEGERKQVTVIFCDIVGFTSLSDRLGPEETYSIIGEVFEILIHRVHHFGGTVNKMIGMMALFGALIAVEDVPQRVIRAALSIHREVARFSEWLKRQKDIPPIKMRIGIHIGPVVVGM